MVADSTSRSPLVLPYDSHPEFQFAVRELAVDRKSVESFSEAYRQIESAPLLSEGDRARLEKIAYDALAAIFDELERGSDDATVRAFLAELRQQCQRVLTADFKHFAGRNQEDAAGDEPADLRRLKQQKFFLGQVSANCLQALSRVARDPVATFRGRAAEGKLTRDELSVNQGVVPRDIVRILNPEFERLGINRIVSAYAHKRVQVVGVALELSVPEATWWRNLYRVPRPAHTLYAHTDEGLDYPKSIVYLTDVGERNGPMGVYPGCEERLRLDPLQKLVGRIVGTVGCRPTSALYERYKVKEAHQGGFTSELFRQHFSMLPRSMRYNSHFGWDVVPDSALEKSLVDAEVKMLGPAGTFAVFDGSRLLHRGGLVEEGERIALQVIFGEPPSLFSLVTGKLTRIVKEAEGTEDEMRQRLRHLRVRVGRTLQRYSFAPEERLSRKVARILPPMVCVDIGASYYPHAPWEVFRRSARTVWMAVEPNEKNVTYLKDWHWPSRPRLEAVGLSEHGGEQLLYVTNVDSGSSLLPPVITANMEHREDKNYLFPVTEKRIQTKSLQEILRNAPDIDDEMPIVVKLDTQGTELSILRGAERLFDERRIVGIETEASLLAEPVMAGSGKFWEVCQFLEARGFELLQLKPIEAPLKRPSGKLRGRAYLNECDAAFCLKHDEIHKKPAAHSLALLGFYLSYRLFEEAAFLVDKIPGFDAICAKAHVSSAEIRSLLRS